MALVVEARFPNLWAGVNTTASNEALTDVDDASTQALEFVWRFLNAFTALPCINAIILNCDLHVARNEHEWRSKVWDPFLEIFEAMQPGSPLSNGALHMWSMNITAPGSIGTDTPIESISVLVHKARKDMLKPSEDAIVVPRRSRRTKGKGKKPESSQESEQTLENAVGGPSMAEEPDVHQDFHQTMSSNSDLPSASDDSTPQSHIPTEVR